MHSFAHHTGRIDGSLCCLNFLIADDRPDEVLISSGLPVCRSLVHGALDVIAHLRRWGPAVILSDGDVVFQPRQGHYALDPGNIAACPSAGKTIEHIGDLLNDDVNALLGATKADRTP